MDVKHKKKPARRNSLKIFGSFLALHLKKKKFKNKVNEAIEIEAGFIDKNGDSNENKTHKKSNSVSSNASSLSVNNNAKKNGFANGTVPNGTSKTVGINGQVGRPVVPGVMGLYNHGNTCFMSAILQCLSNTDTFAEYLIMGHYKNDLKYAKRDKTKKFGTKGELTQQLAAVIKSLWTGTYDHNMTKAFKEVVCKYGAQYKGNSQHDSQEFLLWILDKLHEDLIIQKRKKGFFKSSERKQSITSFTSKDLNKVNPADLAPTSFIQNLFQAHYDSTITCPVCNKQCQTKEPFLCVSLPVGQRTTSAVYVTVVHLPNKRRSGLGRKRLTGSMLQIGIPAPTTGKILQLRQLVSAECGVHSRLLAFADLCDSGFGKSFGDDGSISDIPKQTTAQLSPLHAFQLPPLVKMKAGTLPRNFVTKHKKQLSKESFSSRSSQKEKEPENIAVILVNREGEKGTGKRFGRPIVFRALRDISSSDLQSSILSHMSDLIKHGIRLDQIGQIFDLHVVGNDGSENEIPQVETKQPFLSKIVDDALANCPAGGPLHVKLVAEWDSETREAVFNKNTETTVTEHDSVRLQRVVHQQPYICSLDDCFDLHTKEEVIDCETARQCPHCNMKQHGDKMKLSFYSLPEILVVNLKRFQVVGGRRTKLHTRVEFPITGLNLSSHKLSNGTANGKWADHISDKDNIYDLYGICNHFGNLNSGHYTACCRNPINGKWYLFDDTKTECISEEKLLQQPAYILFYQRRSTSHANPAISYNKGGSMTSLASDHWAYSLPQFQHKRANSQTHLNQYSILPFDSSNPVFPVQRYDKAPMESARQPSENNNYNSSNNNVQREIAQENGRRFSDMYRSHRIIRNREHRKSSGDYPLMQRQRSLKSRHATQL